MKYGGIERDFMFASFLCKNVNWICVRRVELSLNRFQTCGEVIDKTQKPAACSVLCSKYVATEKVDDTQQNKMKKCHVPKSTGEKNFLFA